MKVLFLAVVIISLLPPFLLPAQELKLNTIIERALEYSHTAKGVKIQDQVNRYQYLSFMRGFLPDVALSLSGPSYTHSISPVTQPDGSINYIDVTNLTFNQNLGISLPVLFTGGSISFQSYLNYYYNGDRNSFSSSLYKFNVSQPLRGFNLYQLQRKATKANWLAQSVNAAKECVEIKKNVTILFFQLLESKAKDTLLLKQAEVLEKLQVVYQQLFNNKRLREIDLLELQIYYNEINDELMSLKERQNGILKDLCWQIGLTDCSFDISQPNIPLVHIPRDIAMMYLLQVQAYYYNTVDAAGKQKIAQAKSQKGISGTVNLSAGMNSSSNELNQLIENRLGSESMSLSLNIPLIDWGKKKHQYLIAQLDYQKKMLELETQEELQKNKLLDNIENYNAATKRYYRLLERRDLLVQESKLTLLLLEQQQVNFKKYEDIQKKILETEGQIITELKNAYISYFNVEALTLFDFVHKVKLYTDPI